MAWQFKTNQGHESAPYSTEREAIVRAVMFSWVRACSHFGFHADFGRPKFEDIQDDWQYLVAEGWSVFENDEALVREATCGMWTGSDS